MFETRFTIDHEWVRLSGGVATIGITDYAQQALGEIVYVDLPPTGRTIEIGEPCAVVESIKAASDIQAPLNGTVTDRNDALVDDPALVNRAPQERGWFFKLKLSSTAEFASLMDAAAYQALVDSLV